MSATIGDLKVIHSQMLIFPTGTNEAWVEFKATEWNIKLNFVLATDNDGSETSWEMQGMEDHAIVTLTNWRKRQGTTFEEPYLFGTNNAEKKVYMMICGLIIGKATLKLDLQFYMEVEK